MGRIKEQIIIDEMRGYALPPDKQVCAKMLPHQAYIRERIERNGVEGECCYCGMHDKVLPLSTIVDMVVSAFNEIFENPANEIPFESHGIWDELEGSGLHKEGAGYILPDGKSIMTTEEALEEAGFNPASDELFDDIAGCFLSDDWVVKDALVGTEDERLAYSWQRFWDGTITDSLNQVPYDDIYKHHASLLSSISDTIGSNLHSLRTILSKDSLLYRCVNYKNVPIPLTAENLWAPPVKFATSQRMSRKGQSRFYASFDRETPLSEAVNNGENEYHCLGTFRLKQEVSLLDFTNIPEPYILNVPDYFAYRFLYDFQKAITQHVGESENEKHKYVPTQIMRDLIEKDFSSSGIMGIKYRSVKNDGHSNVVLFLDNDTCGTWLELKDKEIFE